MGDEYTALAHSLNIRLQNAEAENTRLTAEVERWRVKADDLRKLVSAKRIEAARLQGQLAGARAEVERLSGLTSRTRRLLSRILPLLRRLGIPASELASDTEDAIVLHDAALAREDGA